MPNCQLCGEPMPANDSKSRPDAQGGPGAERPQLVHSARESILARWAKYSDPKNLEWEFEFASLWERHAINAVLDLVRVEASERSLREQLSRVSEEKERIAKELSSLQSSGCK